MRAVAIIIAASVLAEPSAAQQAVVNAQVITTCRSVVAAADQADGPKRNVAPADYQPGVDVRGNPVVPADIGPRVTIVDELVIPVQPDVIARLGLDRGLRELRPTVGELRIRLADGRATFNGQALGAAADKELVEACRQVLGGAAIQAR